MDQQVEMKQQPSRVNQNISAPEDPSHVLDTEERMNQTELVEGRTSQVPLSPEKNSATKLAEVPEEAHEAPKVQLPIKEVDQQDIQQAIDQEAFKHDKNRNIQEIIADGGKVNYLELVHHIQTVHPTVEVPVENNGAEDQKPEEPYRTFYLKESLGFLAPKIPFLCQDGDGNAKVTEMAQQLGLGPSLFLMSTKAFAWFFLIISIINIPVFVFFGTGNSAGEFNRLTDLFAILSMGNVGQSGVACNSFKAQELYQNNPIDLLQTTKEQLKQYNQASFIFMNCGIGSEIKSLAYYGLAQNKSSTCKDIYDTPGEYAQWFKSTCIYHNSTSNSLFNYPTKQNVMKILGDVRTAGKYDSESDEKILKREQECVENITAEGKPDFAETWFKCHCVGQSSCKIPGLTKSPKFTYLWNPETSTVNDVKIKQFVYFDRQNWLGYNFKEECMELMQKEAQNKDQSPQVIAVATCISPKITNPFTGAEFNKDQLGVLVVFFDIFSVIGLIIFAQVLLNAQADFVEAFDLASIQMTDFTIRIQNLPHHVHYKRRDAILEAILIQHFQSVIKDELEHMRMEARWMNEEDDDFFNLAKLDDKVDPNKLNPQVYEVADINFGKADMTTNFLLLKMGQLQNQQTRIQIRKKMLKSDTSGCCGPDNKIKNINKEEEKLNENFMKIRDAYLEEVKKEKEVADEEQELQQDANIRYAYVTFRSMDAVDLVKRHYTRRGSCTRWCIRKCCDKCCINSLAEINKKNIFKRWPLITEAVTPDHINWQNLGYSEKYRSIMKVVNWLIAISLIIFSLFFIILLKQQTLELKKEYNINVVCPSDASSDEFKKIAWKDQQLLPNARLGLMHCYCFGQMVKERKGSEVRNIQFQEFSKYNETTNTSTKDKTFYCYDWLVNYTSQQAAIVGTSLIVVVINIIVSLVLSLSVTIEKNHTVSDETMGQFTKLTILQFINIGLIVLIINFDFTGTNEDGTKKLFLGFLPFFNGAYKDFNSEWFSQIGKTLTLTLLMNIFTPHISKLTMPFLKIFKRISDRGCSGNIWRQKKYDEDIDVNTKLVLQNDVNLLYTGDQIASHYVYAQNYTYLCVVLMYSCGLPILYPFAALFYFILYWVYKGLLLKYYARTTKFNQEIPMKSLQWVKFGLVMHIFVASLMLSNQNFFPTEYDEDEEGYLSNSSFDIKTKEVFFIAYFQRLESGSQSTIYLTFIVMLIFGWFTYLFLDLLLDMCSCLRAPIYYCLRCCTCCKFKKHRVKSQDIFAEFQVAQLNTMLDKAEYDLNEFKKAMEEVEGEEKSEAMDIDFKDKRYDQEISTDKIAAISLYERRIRQIELMIDDHLVHLHGEDNLPKFAELKPQEKIWYLMDKQQLVDKSNRMRMVDITQSYNIYDSAMFKDAKQVQEHLDEDPSYNLLSDPKAAQAANEEVKAANEEAKAANEEAKAANEEANQIE